MANGVGEKFCLKWNNFENNISTGFRELRDDKDFFDVTLACDDNQLQAHKVILSACSPFFRSVLKRNPHQHPLLYLKGVKYEEILSVLNFMYHGEVSVAQEELNSFLAVAEDLQVKGLTQSSQKQQQNTPSLPVVKRSLSEKSPASNVMPVNTRPSKEPRIRTSYDYEPAMSRPRAAAGHDRETEDNPFMKTEPPVVDVDCDPELSSDQQLVHDRSDYPAEQGGHEYQHQQRYQEMDPVYEDPVGHAGDTSQDFYSQHTQKATHGEYLCNLCGKQARDLYAMKKHLEGKHEITPGYSCPVCHVFCKTKSILFKHKKTYH